jgi:uncharacterized protein (DUF433 family)
MGREYKNHIMVDNKIHFGKPCITGTRISVENVLELIEEGISFENIIKNYYPDLKIEDIKACVQIDILKIDRKSFSVSSLSDESEDKAYWLSKTPHERLMATELMRQINYGYDPTTARLQRILEIAELTRG